MMLGAWDSIPCSVILGKSFNLFVYKMRGSGHLVPLASFQLFSSIISFDGEGPTA